MKKPFTIRDLRAEAGDKAKGWLNLSDTYYGGLRIPVVLINGSSQGKTLFLCSGVHGNEYVGMTSILKVAQQIEPSQLAGQVLCIPFLNVAAFERITREGPFDGLNLNRIFPGRPDGFLSERIAHLVSSEIFPVVDYAVDLHSATANDIQSSFSCVHLSDGKSVEMAKAFGLEMIWDLDSGPGKPTGATSPTSFNGAAMRSGVANIAVEIGGEGRCRSEWVDLAAKGILNVLRSLGMLGGEPEGLPSTYRVVEGFWRSGSAGGFIRNCVELNCTVTRNQLISTIVDLQGDTIEEIRSDLDGVIIGLRTLPKINPGDWTHWPVKVVKLLA